MKILLFINLLHLICCNNKDSSGMIGSDDKYFIPNKLHNDEQKSEKSTSQKPNTKIIESKTGVFTVKKIQGGLYPSHGYWQIIEDGKEKFGINNENIKYILNQTFKSKEKEFVTENEELYISNIKETVNNTTDVSYTTFKFISLKNHIYNGNNKVLELCKYVDIYKILLSYLSKSRGVINREGYKSGEYYYFNDSDIVTYNPYMQLELDLAYNAYFLNNKEDRYNNVQWPTLSKLLARNQKNLTPYLLIFELIKKSGESGEEGYFIGRQMNFNTQYSRNVSFK